MSPSRAHPMAQTLAGAKSRERQTGFRPPVTPTAPGLGTHAWGGLPDETPANTCTSTHVRARTHMRTLVHTHTHASTRAHAHIWAHTYASTCMRSHMHTCEHLHAHTCAHVHARVHTHAHTQAHVLFFFKCGKKGLGSLTLKFERNLSPTIFGLGQRTSINARFHFNTNHYGTVAQTQGTLHTFTSSLKRRAKAWPRTCGRKGQAQAGGCRATRGGPCTETPLAGTVFIFLPFCNNSV